MLPLIVPKFSTPNVRHELFPPPYDESIHAQDRELLLLDGPTQDVVLRGEFACQAIRLVFTGVERPRQFGPGARSDGSDDPAPFIWITKAVASLTANADRTLGNTHECARPTDGAYAPGLWAAEAAYNRSFEQADRGAQKSPATTPAPSETDPRQSATARRPRRKLAGARETTPASAQAPTAPPQQPSRRIFYKRLPSRSRATAIATRSAKPTFGSPVYRPP